MSEARKFKVGDRVTHKGYGVGTVNVVDESRLLFYVIFDEEVSENVPGHENGHGWWCKDSDLAAANKSAAITGGKFKVGDIVDNTIINRLTGGEIMADNGDGTYQIKWPNWRQECCDPFDVLRLSATAPAQHAIVALIESGQPMPASRPFVHADIAAATKEAERLARKRPGQKFGVYQLVTARIGTVSVAEA